MADLLDVDEEMGILAEVVEDWQESSVGMTIGPNRSAYRSCNNLPPQPRGPLLTAILSRFNNNNNI